jgi:hypothetical protein
MTTATETISCIQDRDDVMRDTVQHVRRVQELTGDVTASITRQVARHDETKFSDSEWPHFVDATSQLKGLTYGSPEYRDAIAALKPALDHHYSVNRHHPEHFQEGVGGMTLVDLVEMLADWRAATERHADGDMWKSLTINAGRFNIAPQLQRILANTVAAMEWASDGTCRDAAAPLRDGEFRAGDRDCEIIGHWAEDGTPYTITVPHQLRETFLEILNSL